MTGLCKYLSAPEEAFVLVGGDLLPTAHPRSLCVWGHYHLTAPGALADCPPWVQRAAMSGDLVRPKIDCLVCPHFEAGEAVE